MMSSLRSIKEFVVRSEQVDPARLGRPAFRYIDIASVDRETKQITQAKETPVSEAPSRARKLVRAEDVLVSTVRPNLNAVAQVGAALDGEIASTGFCVLRVEDREKLLPRYLFHLVRSRQFVEEMTTQATGASYPAVSDRVVLDYRLDGPPPPADQRRIVEILDLADELRRRRREAVESIDRLPRALFREAFRDYEVHVEAPSRMRIADVLLDCRYGTSAKADGQEGDLPVLRMNNIQFDGFLNLDDLKQVILSPSDLKLYDLRDGDLLFNRTNSKELVGKTGLWDGRWPATFASYLIRLRVDTTRVTPEFTWAWMNTPHMKGVILGTARKAIGMANINAREIGDFPVFLPSLEQQRDYGQRLRECLAVREAAIGARTDLDTLFTTLLERAFAGGLTREGRSGTMRETLQEMEIQSRRQP